MTYSPVCNIYPALSTALKSAPQVLLQAPTGSGKSTILPLLMLKDASVTGRIIMLEPRRIAARSVAHRLASQLGERPGKPWVTGCAVKPGSVQLPGLRLLQREFWSECYSRIRNYPK